MEKPAEETNGQWHRFVDVSASQESFAYTLPVRIKEVDGKPGESSGLDSMARAISGAKRRTQVR